MEDTQHTGTTGSQPAIIDLADLVSRDRRAWRPDKDADQPRLLLGLIVKVDSVESDYDDQPVPQVEILPDGDPNVIWRVTCYPSVLRREMGVARPAQGDRIAIVFTGTGTSSKGSYSSFRVAVDHATPVASAVDWAAVEKGAAEDEEIEAELAYEEPF